MARDDGFRTMLAVQEKRNAGPPPKASFKYAYSPPDLGIIVPSSAKQRAPRRRAWFYNTKHKRYKIRNIMLYMDNINY